MFEFGAMRVGIAVIGVAVVCVGRDVVKCTINSVVIRYSSFL